MQEELVSLGQRETEGCLCQENKNSPWIGLNNPFFRLNKKKNQLAIGIFSFSQNVYHTKIDRLLERELIQLGERVFLEINPGGNRQSGQSELTHNRLRQKGIKIFSVSVQRGCRGESFEPRKMFSSLSLVKIKELGSLMDSKMLQIEDVKLIYFPN